MATDGSTGLTRRALLAGAAASAIPLTASGADRALFLSGCRLPDGRMAGAVFDETGEILAIEPLDGRAHGGAVAPDRSRAVLFARRPGRFAIVFDQTSRTRVAAFAPPPDRVFAGHGAFSADGRLLYAAENDFEADRGVIGIYDSTDGFRRIGEFPTFGIGPHEVCLLRDGQTLAIANGGIATHPDFPRTKLNIATMAPSLTLVSAADGTCLANARLPASHHKLSIRHMAERGRGEIWFGAQYEGPAHDAVPLVGTFDERRGLSLIDAPSVYGAFSQYVGSVASSGDGDTVITTSPRGGVAVEWDGATRKVRQLRKIADVCGAAPRGRAAVLLTAGTGEIRSTDDAPQRIAPRAAVQWDNHVTAL